MITVTLQQIKNANPCQLGWYKVLKANGGIHADLNKPFPLVSILDSNGLDDTLWVIENVPELSVYDIIWRKFAKWCALQTIIMIKPYCFDDDYKLIVEYLESESDELTVDVQRIAESAAHSVLWSTRTALAHSAAHSVLWSARSALAHSAAHSVLWSARSAAAAAELLTAATQETKLRELLS